MKRHIPRFAQLGVIPLMQPVHCTSDMGWAEQRLGPQRIQSAYAWRVAAQDWRSFAFELRFSGGKR